MNGHVTDLLALAAAGALDQAEAARIEAHLRECAACAAEAGEWRHLTEGLRRLPAPKPSRALVARTVEAVESRLAERAERAWNRAALGFVVAFAWTLAVVAWVVLDLLAGGLRQMTLVGRQQVVKRRRLFPQCVQRALRLIHRAAAANTKDLSGDGQFLTAGDGVIPEVLTPHAGALQSGDASPVVEKRRTPRAGQDQFGRGQPQRLRRAGVPAQRCARKRVAALLRVP